MHSQQYLFSNLLFQIFTSIIRKTNFILFFITNYTQYDVLNMGVKHLKYNFKF